jgi:hypothetical protein
VAPGEHHIVEAAVGLIDPIFSRENLVIRIGVVCKSLRVDDLVREFTSDDCGKELAFDQGGTGDVYLPKVSCNEMVSMGERGKAEHIPRQHPTGLQSQRRPIVFRGREGDR